MYFQIGLQYKFYCKQSSRYQNIRAFAKYLQMRRLLQQSEKVCEDKLQKKEEKARTDVVGGVEWRSKKGRCTAEHTFNAAR